MYRGNGLSAIYPRLDSRSQKLRADPSAARSDFASGAEQRYLYLESIS